MFGKSITEKGRNQMKIEGLYVLALWVGHVTHSNIQSAQGDGEVTDFERLLVVICHIVLYLLLLHDLLASSISSPNNQYEFTNLFILFLSCHYSMNHQLLLLVADLPL